MKDERTRRGPQSRCTSCGAALRSKDKFCPNCGAAVSAAAPATSAPGPSLQVGPGPARLEEQRKVVTVMFADISGSTPLGERLDPEEMRSILADYFNVLARQIKRFGGTVDKFVGDAVMAVFGAPVSHEDDTERAVRAALAMQAAIAAQNDALERRHGVRLGLKIGVNTGEVVAGLLAGEVQSAYTVVGDTVNTAQRLESAAQHGEVIVGETTHALARRAFVFEPIPPLTLKGKRDPVPAFRAIRAADQLSFSDVSPFVGRGAELATLAGLFAAAEGGRGQVVHVYGEAGVGKSRVVRELIHRLPAHARALRSRCISYETQSPYALVADFIRRLFAIETADGESSARSKLLTGMSRLTPDEVALALYLELLGYAARSALDPEAKRRLLLSLLRQVLRQQSAESPFVLLAEDVHWIDAASAALVRELVEEIGGLRCMVLTTARDVTSAAWPAAHLALSPLDDDAAGALVDSVADLSLAPDVRALVLQRSGGNPFFIEEVGRNLAAGRASVPETVQEVLEARLDRLDPQPRRVAQSASVVGRSFILRLLVRMHRNGPVEPSISILENDRFIAARTIHPELTYSFRHALVQEVIYQTQLLAQRRVLHARVGEAIEELFADRLEEFVDELALHYARSDNDEKALHWLVRAADRAKALFANAEALALYESALKRAKDGDGPLDAGTILERMGDVLALTGRNDDAIATFRSAADRSGSHTPSGLARMHRKVGVALRMKGDYRPAFDEFAHGLEVLGGTDDVEAARIYVQIGQLHFRRGDHVAARPPLSLAIEIGERLREDRIVAEALSVSGLVADALGDLNTAMDCYQRSQAIYERSADEAAIAAVRNNIGMFYRRTQRYDEALEQYRFSLAVYERTGNLWAQGVCHNNIGEAYRLRGDLAQAMPAYERATAIFESIGARAEAAAALMNLGSARVESGDLARGRALLLEAEERLGRLGSTTYLIGLNRYLASAELAAGDLSAARRRAERSLELARAAKARLQEATAQRVLGEVLFATGEVAEARALLEASRATLTEVGARDELRRTEAVLAGLDG